MADPLKDIARVRKRRDRQVAKANAELVELIRAARGMGSPWARIAEAMGMTRDGVVKFLERHPE